MANRPEPRALHRAAAQLRRWIEGAERNAERLFTVPADALRGAPTEEVEPTWREDEARAAGQPRIS